MIEEWVPDNITAECNGTSPSYNPAGLWTTNVVPYLDTAIKVICFVNSVSDARS